MRSSSCRASSTRSLGPPCATRAATHRRACALSCHQRSLSPRHDPVVTAGRTHLIYRSRLLRTSQWELLESPPSDPSALSFWLGARLPLTHGLRAGMLACADPLKRLLDATDVMRLLLAPAHADQTTQRCAHVDPSVCSLHKAIRQEPLAPPVLMNLVFARGADSRTDSA